MYYVARLATFISFWIFVQDVGAQNDVCGRPCKTDVQCPDDRGICTYCLKGMCSKPRRDCGGPAKANTTKPQLLVVGDRFAFVFVRMDKRYAAFHP